MTTDIKIASPTAPVWLVAQLMKDNDTGFIPIEDKDGLVGVITDRDITLRWVAKQEGYVTASEIMSINPIYISPEHSVTEAARLMSREKIRRLPVCKDRQVIGIISLGDISRAKSFFAESAAALCDICDTF